MASINERRSIEQEIVLAVRGTPTGVKVVEYDGVGMASGIMTKRNRRYFYGDSAKYKAHSYAERKRDKIAEVREEDVYVVPMDTRIHERLAEVRD